MIHIHSRSIVLYLGRTNLFQIIRLTVRKEAPYTSLLLRTCIMYGCVCRRYSVTVYFYGVEFFFINIPVFVSRTKPCRSLGEFYSHSQSF
ncbi:hypothetical protein PUN28_013135 [Cardiocondyla obscurior]|uniref:Uncharacterized protein n=1 Tax=Cardiocondyla obscurior TaxID=286306 RepID=A0AAW2FCQ7_9HYME